MIVLAKVEAVQPDEPVWRRHHLGQQGHLGKSRVDEVDHEADLYLGVVSIQEYCSGGVTGPTSYWRSNESIKKIVSSSFSVQLVAVTSFYKLLDTFSCHRPNTE